MTYTERPWEDLHHRSTCLPDKERVENQLRTLKDHVDTAESTLDSQNPLAKGNLSNISKTISIDVSIKPIVINHIQIGTECFPEEIQIYTALFKEFRDVFAWSMRKCPELTHGLLLTKSKPILGLISFDNGFAQYTLEKLSLSKLK